jgi:AraC-like DNA-binding protein
MLDILVCRTPEDTLVDAARYRGTWYRLVADRRHDRWIRENFTVPLRVEALASMPALSISAFHRHFKAVTALSPLQYQKRIRLLHARSPLIAGEGNTTSVAFGVGYESPTQFSREYSRFFGLPPSRDSRQIVRALQPIS